MTVSRPSWIVFAKGRAGDHDRAVQAARADGAESVVVAPDEASVDRALREAKTELVAIVRAGVVVDRGWADALAKTLADRPKAVAAGTKRWTAPAGSSPRAYRGHITLEEDDWWTKTDDASDDSVEVATLASDAVLLRREAALAVGGPVLDEALPAEPLADFFARAIEAGFELHYAGGPGTSSIAEDDPNARARDAFVVTLRHLGEDARLRLRGTIRASRLRSRVVGLFGGDSNERARATSAAFEAAERVVARSNGNGAYERAVTAIQSRSNYYGHERPEVAALIPASAREVIDVGCGAGGLGRGLKRARAGVHVRGLEIVPEAAERARAVLDEVRVGSAEAPPPEDWPEADAIIFADVLEHLVDPWSTLVRWRARLKPGGSLVVSLPNVLHQSVTRGALEGRWDYVDAGVLDRTHLRFFTRATALEMIEGAGFRVEHVERLIDVSTIGALRAPVHALLRAQMKREREGREGSRWSARLADLFTVQFLVRAT